VQYEELRSMNIGYDKDGEEGYDLEDDEEG